MRNRFPGYCYKCGCCVPTGYGFFEKLRRPENGRDVRPWHREVARAERMWDGNTEGGAL